MNRADRPLVVGLAFFISMAAGSVVRGQAASPSNQAFQNIERQQQLQEMEQDRLDSRLLANPDVPPDQRALIDYGGYFTFNYLSLDDSTDKDHGLRQYDLVGYTRINLDGASEFFARVKFSYQNFNPGDGFNGRGDNRWLNADGDQVLDRGYYRFDLARYAAAYEGKVLPYDVTFQAGRDLVYWGNGLALGEVLDGAIVTASYGKLTLQGIYGITPSDDVDIDTSRPNFDTDTRREFYGGMLSAQLGTIKPYVYGLIQRDWNDQERIEGKIDTSFDYNSFYVGTGATGTLGDHFIYSAEGVFEGGDTLSNSFTISGVAGILEPVVQTHDPIQAAAGDFRLDYLPGDLHKSRVSGEVILASGGPDRGTTTNTFNGNAPNSTDQAFNAFGLINTGLAFAPNISNVAIFRVGASTFPLPDSQRFSRLQVGADFFVYDKMRLHAPIVEATNNKAYLGVEPDLYLNWQLTSDITLAVRYGVFFPCAQTIVGNTDPRQFFYTGVTFAF